LLHTEFETSKPEQTRHQNP